MRLHIANERLPGLIARAGAAAQSNRQVARRLHTLLELRLQELKREHRRACGSAAAAERLALTDPRYEEYVRELVELASAGLSARIEYETYTMLYKARQTLRCLRHR